MNFATGWNNDGNALVRIVVRKNFVDAVALVNAIVPIAEGMNHHPNIEIFGYKNVKIKLTTYDAGNTITKKDVELACKINSHHDDMTALFISGRST